MQTDALAGLHGAAPFGRKVEWRRATDLSAAHEARRAIPRQTVAADIGLPAAHSPLFKALVSATLPL